MTLTLYKKKRKFNETPEPKAKLKRSLDEHQFVVHKHDASHLHYDLRLEMEGVLKSWAIPKGPSMNPNDKRLAIMVEDHPLDYGKFEGIIPEGNYGAGTVMIWDEGTYQAIDTKEKTENEKALLEGLQKGNLKIILKGKKLNGEFALVKMHLKKGNEWLFIKKKDEYANVKDVLNEDKSIVTKRSLEQIKTQSGKKKESIVSDKITQTNHSKKKAKMKPAY